MSKTLFDLGADAEALDALLTELEGDISDPAVAEAIDAWLQENHDGLEKKLDGYGALIREREAKAEARKAEAARLLELSRTDENMAKRLKERLFFFFDERGVAKKETARFKFSIVSNGGKLPLIIDPETNPEEISVFLQKHTVDFDKDAIRTALENEDVLDFARLGERGRSLRIK